MNPTPLKRKLPGVMCLAYLAAIQTERGIFLARGTDIPGPSVQFDYVVFACLMGYWFEVDSRETRVLRLWDMGYFLSFGWPFIIPYYLAKTRGMKRAVFILALLATFCFGVELSVAILFLVLR